MKFYTSYWSSKQLCGLPRSCFLRVSRTYPEGWSDIKSCRELFPSWSCLQEWRQSDKSAEAWKRYENTYWRETLRHIDVKCFVDRYGSEITVLLCYEANVLRCHRGTIGRWLRWNGYNYEGEL